MTTELISAGLHEELRRLQATVTSLEAELSAMVNRVHPRQEERRSAGRETFEVQIAAMQIFDVSDPTSIPAALGSVTTGTSPRNVSVQGKYAYVVTSTSGTLETYDVSDKSAPVRVDTRNVQGQTKGDALRNRAVRWI